MIRSVTPPPPVCHDVSRESFTKTDINYSGSHMYLVVGYRDHPSSTYKEINLFGLYHSSQSAQQRIFQITGIQSNNLCRGNYYCCWINKIIIGDFLKTPNAGANDYFPN